MVISSCGPWIVGVKPAEYVKPGTNSRDKWRTVLPSACPYQGQTVAKMRVGKNVKSTTNAAVPSAEYARLRDRQCARGRRIKVGTRTDSFKPAIIQPV